jgi:hypothetical protein
MHYDLGPLGPLQVLVRRCGQGILGAAVLWVCLTLLFPVTGYAQEQSAPADTDTIKTLLQRVQELESEVKDLHSQVQALSAAQASEKQPAAPVAAAQPVASAPAPAPPAVQATTSMVDGMQMSGSSNESIFHSPRLNLRGYGDVDWNASDLKGSTNSFVLGQFNLFITSRVSQHATFLAETVIEADEGTNEFGIEPERLLLDYSVNDHLNLVFGRYHTGIGYYNTAYHHSALLQTTLERPFLFEFEDGGGILPIHSVGISATGLAWSKPGLHYIAEMGNGRSARTSVSNPVQNVTDENNGKAVNLGFFFRPDAWPGWQFGFSEYHDHLTPLGPPNVTENIFSTHLVFHNSRFEVLNEGVLLRHTLDGGLGTTNIPAFYSQVSRRFGNYRPYFRYEYTNVPASDPLYADAGLQHGPKAGLRYDVSESAAFKVEFGRTWRRNLEPVNSVGTQLSFAF